MIAARVVVPLVLALAGCVQPAEQTGFASRSRVHHPGALFDVAPRSDLVRMNNPRRGRPNGAPYCPRDSDLKPYGALMTDSIAAMRGPGKVEYSKVPRQFAHELTISAYRTLMDLDMARSRRDIDALRAHAGANAWIPAQRSDPAASAAIEAVGAVLPAWQILRQTTVATDDDRAAVDGWLLRVARFTDIHPGGNSIGTQRGTNAMMLGLIVGDDALYRNGLQESFYAQLRGMRPDGSFPLETDRGRKALEHSGRNIALLVYAAQIGLSQGIDLYATEVDGKSLDDAIGFLLRAEEDNALVDVYARANRNPGLGFGEFAPNAQVTPFAGFSRGWIMLYTQRFPNGELSDALLGKIELGNRVFSDTNGGSVSCYATRL
jgi:Alginate lyase